MSEWTLSKQAEAQARRLGIRLAPEKLVAMLSSPEPKALSTAFMLAEHTKLEVVTLEGLREHRREEWLAPEALERNVQAFFERRDEGVFGEESACEALARFRLALETHLTRLPPGDIGVVSHARVLTLFVDALHPLDDLHAFWRGLTMPSLVVMDWPSGRRVLQEGPDDWRRDEPEREGHVVAVDLGLRCGIAVFKTDGTLVRYKSTNFGSRTRMKSAVYSILAEIDALERVVVEGDSTLAAVWRKAARKLGARFKTVLPEVWRQALLDPSAQRTGADAKRNADVLAREIIARSGLPAPTSLRHDAAEAIAIGAWSTGAHSNKSS